MPSVDATVRDGHAPLAAGAQALRVASRGLRTMRDLANFTIAHSVDVLRGETGVREANASLRGISETRKLIVDGQRVGYVKDVLDQPAESPGEEALRLREAELTAELEALRERRGA